MKFIKNEQAVSEVIGVILAVAITVILAAVVASFLFGGASNVEKTKVITTHAVQKGDTLVEVTFVGGPDAAAVSALNVSVNGNWTRKINPKVGDVIQNNNGTPSKDDRVIVSAKFKDGTSQVVLNTNI